MALSKADLDQVQDFVRTHISDWLPQPVFQLGERIVRVEEELRHQRELMREGFAATATRFADLQAHTDKRFAVLTWMIGIGFVVVTSLTSVFALVS